jgi:hypothetical protein
VERNNFVTLGPILRLILAWRDTMNSSTQRIVTSIVLALSNALMLSAQTSVSEDAPSKQKLVLVELFTSEGCSDCPPADELLRRIDQKETGTGQLIVGISEHVTYWNSLGWADPFSLNVYDQRQSAYSSRFGLDSVYTPQMVVNGTNQFVGSDSEKLSQALHKEDQQPPPIAVHIVSTTVADRLLNVTYSASGDFPPQEIDIIAVLADDTDRSSVQRGENSGRNLTHVAVARSLSRLTKLKSSVTESTAQLPLPPSYQRSQAHHLILFAQAAGNGRVLGTDTKSF